MVLKNKFEPAVLFMNRLWRQATQKIGQIANKSCLKRVMRGHLSKINWFFSKVMRLSQSDSLHAIRHSSWHEIIKTM